MIATRRLKNVVIFIQTILSQCSGSLPEPIFRLPRSGPKVPWKQKFVLETVLFLRKKSPGCLYSSIPQRISSYIAKNIGETDLYDVLMIGMTSSKNYFFYRLLILIKNLKIFFSFVVVKIIPECFSTFWNFNQKLSQSII